MGAPVFIHREMPVYPVLARRLGKEGKVILKLLIDRNGKMQNVEVVEHAGFGFTEAAVAAVKKSTYAPASRNGENVTTRALLPVRFRLQ
jgi:periplasmic protein TonB